MNIDELRQKLASVQAWVKDNPALAAVIGAGAVFVFVFLGVIVSLLSGSGPSKTEVQRAETESNICARIQTLAHLEGQGRNKLSANYFAALKKAYAELTKDDASPEDVLTLSRQSTNCDGLSNDDLAWRVQIDTRLRRGLWPVYPRLPPTSLAVANELRDVVNPSSLLKPKLPSEPEGKRAWLELAALGGTDDSPLLSPFYRPDQSQAEDLALYSDLVTMGSGAEWLAKRLYLKLGLLPEPVFVRDDHPAKDTPASVLRGPGETLRFLGTFDSDRCVIGTTDAELPPLWVRSCKGLVPRRLSKGELVLVGAPAPLDGDTQAHWLPVLFDETGEVAFGAKLAIDARVLATFMIAAPRFQLSPKGWSAFDHAPTVAQAHDAVAGDGFPSFRTAAEGKPTLLAFAPEAPIKLAKKCANIEKDRCDAVRGGDPSDHCAFEPSRCYVLPGDAELRATAVTIVWPDSCIKEYGVKSTCPADVSVGLFVDVRRPGETAYSDGPFIEMHSARKE